MTIYRTKPIALGGLRTYPLAKRPSLVSIREFARPHRRGGSLASFLNSLPRILAGNSFRELVAAILAARRKRRAILWGLGGHVIKCGLNPVIIDLLRRGFVTGIALSGAGLIHDFEVALVGSTSEDVAASLGRGRFGMAEETGRILNEAIGAAAREGTGIGESVGRWLAGAGRRGQMRPRYGEHSLLASAYRMKVPVTVHLAVGTDIFHVHPAVDGAALGAATHTDFRLFCGLVRGLANGGVYLNVGSAVVLPEVFLKAVSVVRNLGAPLRRIKTANLDFIQHYRPTRNVLERPTEPGGRGIALTAHHELLLPLLAAALVEGKA